MNQDNEQERDRAIQGGAVILEYLKSFSDHSKDGSGDIRLDCPVDRSVLEALAKILYTFVNNKGLTLDTAFGGKTRNQIREIKASYKAYGLAFEIIQAKESSLTNEQVILDFAKKNHMSPDTVRDLYKLSGRNGPRKRGGKSK